MLGVVKKEINREYLFNVDEGYDEPESHSCILSDLQEESIVRVQFIIA